MTYDATTYLQAAKNALPLAVQRNGGPAQLDSGGDAAAATAAALIVIAAELRELRLLRAKVGTR